MRDDGARARTSIETDRVAVSRTARPRMRARDTTAHESRVIIIIIINHQPSSIHRASVVTSRREQTKNKKSCPACPNFEGASRKQQVCHCFQVSLSWVLNGWAAMRSGVVVGSSVFLCLYKKAIGQWHPESDTST